MGGRMRKYFILFTILLLALTGCGKKKQKKKTKEPQEVSKINLENYIYSAPSGFVSLDKNLVIKFEENMVQEHLVNTILDNTPLQFTPNIEGKFYWAQRDKLVFEPTNNLSAGKEFQGVLSGEKAFGKKAAGQKYSFIFKTPEQEIKEINYEFQPIKSDKKGVVRLSGTIDFYAPVNVDRVQKKLEVELEGSPISFSVIQKGKKSIELNTEKFQRGEKMKNINLSLPKKYTPGDEKWNKKLLLAGIKKFSVLAAMPMKKEDKTYGFRFSHNISEQFDISGFVSIEPSIPYKVKIEGKYLKIKGDFLSGKKYNIKINSGLPSESGQKLESSYLKSFRFSNIKPQVKWVSKGVYLPHSNNYKVQFKSINLRMARLRVYRIYKDNLGFFLQRNVIKKAEEYDDIDRTGKEIYDEEIQINGKRNEWQLNEVDLSSVFNTSKQAAYVMFLNFEEEDLVGKPTNEEHNVKSDELYYEDTGYYSNPAERGYYYDDEHGEKSKMLISSNIGLTIKNSQEGEHVYAFNFVKAKPIKGLELNLYSYQNQILETRRTDSEGHVLFKKEGHYIKGTTENGIAIIKTDHDDWEISNFDVSGVSTGKNELNIFTYTDRGVYRPGKDIHFSAIVRSGTKTPPKNQPIILKVFNPEDQVVVEKKKKVGEYGHCYFKIQTSNDAPTGDWKARLKFAGQRFDKWIKVETVKPNRIKVTMDFPDKFVGKPLNLEGKISSKYLFGAPAAESKVESELILREKQLSIPGFGEYSFENPLKDFTSRRKDILEDKLDSSGEIHLKQRLSSDVEQARALRGVIKTTVYEKGGNPVTEVKNIEIYPDTVLPGIRTPKDNYLKEATSYNFPIIAAGLSGKLIGGRNLQITHYVNRYHWWWYYDDEDRKKFRQLKSTFKIDERRIVSSNSPQDYKVEIEDEGTHYICVKDEETGKTSGIFFRTSHWGDADKRKDKKEQDFLKIKTNKEVYNPNDEAKISFKSPGKGIYLCTIEQDNNVLKQFVNNVDKGRTTVKVDLSKTMIPNCYASISVIQPHSQTSNDVPMRTYGIQPIKVESPQTHLNLKAEIPDKVRPKEQFNIKVKNNSNRDASTTIAIVDEGLLDLTDFSTPRPWKHYFQKIGLSISTTDNYDEIYSVLLPDVDKKFSIGGSRSEAAKRSGYEETQEINRFKPTVLYKKPSEIQANSSRTFKFDMPNYVGSVRAMIIGCGGHSYGSIEKNITVKEPLMVLPTIPRLIHPGDKFELPVSVFAMKDSIGEVKVHLKTSDNLSVANFMHKIKFTKEGDKQVQFNIQAKDAIGKGNIQIQAFSSTDTASNEVDVPLSPANPYVTKVTDTTIRNKGKISLTPKKFGLKSTNSAELVFTKIPDLNLDKHLNHLIRYPYGCIEQITSKSFAQLYLDDLIDLKKEEKQAAQRFIQSGISKLPSFITSRGFSYWPHRSDYADWCSIYVGHFMVCAKEIGYNVPDHLMEHWITSEKSRVRDGNESDHRYQTYRLFVLALAGKPDFGAMNLVRQNYIDQLGPVSRKLLAAAYHISGKKKVAEKVNNHRYTSIKNYRELGGTYGSDIRDMSLMAYCSIKMDNIRFASKIVESITKRFNEQHWFSTQEISFLTMALAEFYTKSGLSQSDIKFTVDMEGKGEKEYYLSDFQKKINISDMYNRQIEINSKSKSPLFVHLNREGIPKKDIIKDKSEGLILERDFFDEEGRTINIDTLEQNQAIWVRYRVKCSTGEELEEVALSSLFPAGWEIINPRMTETGYPDWVQRDHPTNGEYMDIRDDRVNWFFDVDEDAKTFYIKINPTFAGEYKYPPVSVETMYSPNYYARVASQRVVVK